MKIQKAIQHQLYNWKIDESSREEELLFFTRTYLIKNEHTIVI